MSKTIYNNAKSDFMNINLNIIHFFIEILVFACTGSFTYALFTKYIVLPDIVDDFMLLSTENVALDILPPSSNQMLK